MIVIANELEKYILVYEAFDNKDFWRFQPNGGLGCHKYSMLTGQEKKTHKAANKMVTAII